MNWRKLLTKAERDHLKELHIVHKKEIAQLRQDQKELTKGQSEACQTCRTIAIKLGIEG